MATGRNRDLLRYGQRSPVAPPDWGRRLDSSLLARPCGIGLADCGRRGRKLDYGGARSLLQ